MPRLKVLREGTEAKVIDLGAIGKTSIVLGRAENADVRLDHRAVGREHAILSMRGNDFFIQKKTEFGKLSVNGMDQSEAALKVGDIITIADFQVRFEDDTVSAAAPTITSAAAISASPTQSVQLTENEAAQISIATDIPVEGAAPPAEAAVATDSGDKTAFLSQAKMSVKLVFQAGAANVEEYEIQKQEISIGRGSTCDIILNDKKASRNHLVIKRVGSNFVAVDQGTGNGTFINGDKITEKELAGDDVLKIGDTEFKFKAVSQQFFEEQAGFLSVPTEEAAPIETSSAVALENVEVPIQGASIVPATVAPVSQPQAASAIPGLTGTVPGLGASTSKKETLLEKFKRQPPARKIIIGLAIGGVILLSMDDDSAKKDPKNAKGKKGAETEKSVPGAPKTEGASFGSLPAEKKQFVVNTYQLALDLYKKQEFDRALYEVNKIFQVLPNGYKDAKELKIYAEKAVEQVKAAAEEKRRKEEEETLRNEIAKLLAQAQDDLDKGKEKEAREAISQILERDPENASALRLNHQFEEREKLAKQVADQKRDEENKRISLEAFINEGNRILKLGKYYEVMEKMEQAPNLGSKDEKLLKSAKDLIAKAKNELKEKTEPFLKKGDSALKSEDYTMARDAFYKALEVDDRNQHAKDSLEQIRSVLHEKARQIYMEGIIAESVSDYKNSRIKYKQCVEQAMPDDIYYGRCSRKYKRLELLEKRVVTGVDPSSQISDTNARAPSANSDPQKPQLPETSEGEDEMLKPPGEEP